MAKEKTAVKKTKWTQTQLQALSDEDLVAEAKKIGISAEDIAKTESRGELEAMVLGLPAGWGKKKAEEKQPDTGVTTTKQSGTKGPKATEEKRLPPQKIAKSVQMVALRYVGKGTVKKWGKKWQGHQKRVLPITEARDLLFHFPQRFRLEA